MEWDSIAVLLAWIITQGQITLWTWKLTDHAKFRKYAQSSHTHFTGSDFTSVFQHHRILESLRAATTLAHKLATLTSPLILSNDCNPQYGTRFL